MNKIITLLAVLFISITAFSQTNNAKKDSANTTAKPVAKSDSTTPVKMVAIVLSESDLQVLSSFLQRGINEAKGDPITSADQIQLHNFLPKLHDYLLKNVIHINNPASPPIKAAKKK